MLTASKLRCISRHLPLLSSTSLVLAISLRSLNISSLVTESSEPVGSSASKMEEFFATARAIAIRCF
jgi:hypothetical protein